MSTHTFYLAPTGQGVGLTSVSIGLVRALDRVGLRVRFIKPIAQPHELDEGPDRSAGMLKQAMNLDIPNPIDLRHAEELMSAGDEDDLMEEVVGNYQSVAEGADVVIVEGLVPTRHQSYADTLNAEIAKTLDAEIILVSRMIERSISDLDERIEIAARLFGGLDHPKMLGGIINKVNLPQSDYRNVGTGVGPSQAPHVNGEDVDEDLLIRDRSQTFRKHNFHLIGTVPWNQRLTSPRMCDIERHTGALLIHRGDLNTRRVTRFAVCARSVENMIEALEPGVLVVTPGDRNDIIVAAAMASLSGVKLAGIMLTSNIMPDQRVMRLCSRAFEDGLPMILVESDTYETAVMLQNFNTEVSLDDLERINRVMDHVARQLDAAWLKDQVAIDRELRLSPPAFRYMLSEAARNDKKRIILPEGDEPRTIQAAAICHERNIANCILVANPDAIRRVADATGVKLPPDITLLDPVEYRDRYVDKLVELRKHKGMIRQTAEEALEDNVVLGTLMLHQDEVDGLVSGAVHTTANTIRPALQLIKTKPGAALVSSIFFMLLPEQVLVYGDCAINPDPNAQELADIAIQSADSAAAFGISPRVAMISYSTGRSGAGADVDKVREATKIAQTQRPDLLIDGPLQYDAAAIANVAAKKAPNSPVAGKATVFVFPDLNTGNTTYKAVQRSANVVSIGPMLQGLRKPVNDLSRGALVDDIVYTIALTAIQAQQVAAESVLTP